MQITEKMLSRIETPCEDGLKWFREEPGAMDLNIGDTK